jgi:uncharacterized protein (TIGR02147 family)
MDVIELQRLLQGTFLKKQATNTRYSLRAFARQLEMSPSAVSEILRGKRKISRRLGERLADRLSLGPEEWKTIFEPKSAGPKQTIPTAYAAFDMDAYHAVAQWHYFAILSLAETKEFDGLPSTIAHRLNISERRAGHALGVLERLKLLARDKDGNLVWTGRNFTTREDVKDLSARRSLREGLDLARQALDHQPVSVREFTAITVAIDPDRLSEAKAMIRAFRDQLAAFLEGGQRRRIYRLGIQLFSLSDKERAFDE